MKNRLIHIIITGTLSLLILASPVLASDISGAIYRGSISVTNSSYTATEVAVPFELGTSSLVSGYYVNSSLSNTAIRDANGNDVPYMPAVSGSTNWMLYAGQVSQNSGENYSLYTGGNGDMAGDIVYFPGNTGMTAADSASLELGNNFVIEQDGYINTDAGSDKNLVYKEEAFKTYISGEDEITSEIYEATDVSINFITRQEIACTSNTTWQTIDISSYVSSDATGALLHVVATSNRGIGARHPDSTDSIYGDIRNGWLWVALDGNQQFEMYEEYRAQQTVYLEAYVENGWDFGTNWDEVTCSTGDVWTEVDISSYVDYARGDVAAIIMAKSGQSSSEQLLTVRSKGSNIDEAYANPGSIAMFIVELTSDESMEIYQDYTSGNHFYVAGVINNKLSTRSSFDSTPQYISTTVSDAWTDLDCSTYCPGADSILFIIDTNYLYTSEGETAGLRKNGDTADLKNWGGSRAAIVECDDDQIVEYYTGNTSYLDFYIKGYFVDGNYCSVASSVTATGIDSGDYEIKTTADGTNLKLYIDDVLKDTDSLGGASVIDNANNWSFASGGSMLYLRSHDITVSGTLKQSVEWQNSSTFSDATAYNNDCIPSFRTTTTDVDVSATLNDYEPFSMVEFSGASDDDTVVVIDTAPTMPTEMYREMETEHLPGADLINEMLTEADIPLSLFWFPWCFISSALLGMLIYAFTRSLFALSATTGMGLTFYSLAGPIPFWVVGIFAIIAIAILIKQGTASY